MNNKKQQLLKEMFEDALSDPEIEQEYAGRMETYCKWCSCYLGNRDSKHDSSCFHIRAREIIRESI